MTHSEFLAISLDTLATELIAQAQTSGQATRRALPQGDQSMQAVLVALAIGNTLAEHDNPGEATMYVVRGSVSLTVNLEDGRQQAWALETGTLAVVPPERHSVIAHEDSAFLLTYIPKARLAEHH